MKQTAVEWFDEQLDILLEMYGSEWDKVKKVFEQAKEMEKQQQGYSEEEVLELIQFLAEREDFEGYHPMSIFIAQDFLNEFKKK
jgi:hypothetical protein